MWVMAAVFALPGIILAVATRLPEFYMFILMPAIIIPLAIWYTVQLVKIPKALAEFSSGIIHIYPSNNERYAINPAEIRFVSQKNYSGRGLTYSAGKLTIETNSGEILLRWVKDADDARRTLESLRDNALKQYN